MKSSQHHYVPKWYLGRFVDPQSRLLHIYDRAKAQFRTQTPSKLMTIGNYYRQEWAPRGNDPNVLEKLAGSFLEPKGENAVVKLLSDPKGLTTEDSAILLLYIAFQRIRVPRQATAAMKLAELVTLSSAERDIVSAFLDGKIELSDSLRFEYMRSVMGGHADYFARMQWDVLHAPDGSSLLTTDSPVSFYNPCSPPPIDPGLRLAGTRVLFPLSSEHILIMRHSEYLADSNVSPQSLVPEPTSNNSGLTITTYPDPLPERSVCEINTCLFQLSQRFVVGRSRSVLESCLIPDGNETGG